ncbi:hypothetical protein [Burkholderia gladioli]|uniref:hypothetical protein n=1 Tax=Burkholderia gladioli TaxID=28095 RepID=UPI001C263E08|nr:hypothetical protein [Burkholderia gladioli]MBU9384732.1 hypothetical protein [Burkholderia gladioli]
MNDDAKNVTIEAFEAAMKRCADDAGKEASFARGEDGDYQQVEMRRAFAGWLGASSLVAHQIMGLARTAKDRFGGNAAFQSGFLQFLEHAAQLLDVTSDASGVPQSDARRDIDAAAFDDAALEGFNRAMKTKMAMARAAGRAGWWSAPASELSTALHAHAGKGDPLDVGIFAMMHWYLNVAIAPLAEAVDQAVAAGELTTVSSDRHIAGQLEIKMPASTIRVSGFPNELTRRCKPLLWEQVEIVIRAARPARSAPEAAVWGPSGSAASTEWLPAGRAAFQIGVDLDIVRAWADANEIEHRDDKGTLMVECASVLSRSHRHWRERVPEQGMNPRAGVKA